MKSTICLILTGVFLSNAAFCKSSADYPDDLFISITNHGSENCVLTQSKVINGQLYKSGLPLTLPADGSTYSFTLTGTQSTSANLTYACGENKTITLYMEQFYKKGHIHTSINAESRNVVNMTETHIKQVTYHNSDGGYPNDSGHQHPGTIEWKLFF